MKKMNISRRQFFTLMLSYMVANDLIRGIYTKDLSQDLWISLTASIFISVFLFFSYTFIYKNTNKESFSEAITAIVGKSISKIIFVLYFLYFIIIAATLTREISQFVERYLSQGVAIYIIAFLLIITVIYVAIKGIEPISKFSGIFMFISILVFFLLLLLLITSNQGNIENILPIMVHDKRLIISLALRMSYGIPMGELFALIVIFQFIKKSERQKAYKLGYRVILLSGMYLLIITLINVFYIEIGALEIGSSPSMRIWRRIDIDDFIQRLDIVILNFIIIQVIIKLVVLYIASKELITNTINIKKKNIIYFIIGIIIFLLVYFLFQNYESFLKFRREIIASYLSLVFEVFIPFIIIIISFIRRNKIRSKETLDYNI